MFKRLGAAWATGCPLEVWASLRVIKPGVMCNRGIHYGLGYDGSFTFYITVQTRAAIPLPKGVSLAERAVATDAVMTTYHAIVRRPEVKKSDVVILGLGGLGFNTLQIVMNIGARIIVMDKRAAGP